MSVLLAYGTSNEAVIMSDSRSTMLNENNEIIDHKDNSKKIYKITDKFIIGCVGSGSAKNILEKINPNNPNSTFNILKDNTYEDWLIFFTKRIKIFGINKLSYSPYIAIGIDINNKIRMDVFDNLTCKFDSVYPKNNIVSTIFLPPDAPSSFKNEFYNGIKTASNKETYCKDIINRIIKECDTVGGEIQVYKVSI